MGAIFRVGRVKLRFMEDSITRRRWRGWHRKRNFPSGPRCPICGSDRSKLFSAIYGYGTTEYRSHHGLIVHTHFQSTRRQSVLAKQCAPPRRTPWWPAIAALAFFGVCRLLSLFLPRIDDLLWEYGYGALWATLVLGMAAALDSYVYYPRRMEAWTRKRLCDRCGTVFEAEP